MADNNDAYIVSTYLDTHRSAISRINGQWEVYEDEDKLRFITWESMIRYMAEQNER
jgi:hypothetical protein